jgi:hypothetical protein
LSILLSTLFLAAAAAAQETKSPTIQPNMVCRKMVLGASRSGDFTICKTRAGWAASDACKGATRYCSPQQIAEIKAKHTAFALTEDSRIICRELKGTGSRLSASKTCLPNREWQRMWEQGSATTRDIQDRYSKLPRGDR